MGVYNRRRGLPQPSTPLQKRACKSVPGGSLIDSTARMRIPRGSDVGFIGYGLLSAYVTTYPQKGTKFQPLGIILIYVNIQRRVRSLGCHDSPAKYWSPTTNSLEGGQTRNHDVSRPEAQILELAKWTITWGPYVISYL